MFGLTPKSASTRHTSRHTTHATHHHSVGRATGTTTRTVKPRRSLFGRNKARVAGGHKSVLSNPNSTSSGRRHAKRELRATGHSTHVPLMTKIKRTLGIRSTPRRTTRTARY